MDQSWPALDLYVEAAAAAAALAGRSAEALRVATWNVWFDPIEGPRRQVALFREVLAKAPDIVCLQEVVPKFAEAVRESKALTEVYEVSPQSIRGYGALLLVRRDFRPAFQEEELPSRMGRTLLWADLAAGPHASFRAMTTHLESLNSEPTRRKQLEIAERLLHGRSAALLCGDFNFDDTKTWGDWRRKKPAHGPEARNDTMFGMLSMYAKAMFVGADRTQEIENRVLKEVLPSFVDAWREVHPDDPGFTFDGATNEACIADRGERMRYDRVMVKNIASCGADRGYHAVAAEMLGTQEMIEPDWGCKPSDHYGLLVDLAVTPA